MKFTAQVLSDHFDELQRYISKLQFTGYPADYQRIDQKTEPVISQLDLFANHKVLDIGSNFGMYPLLTSQIARSVTGLEIDKHLHSVSLLWKQFFEEKGYDFSNLTLLNKGSNELVHIDYDALLLTLVLYHLNDDEVDLLIQDAKQKCQKIIIQCRPARILARQKGAFTGHVSKTSRYDGLFDIAANVRFLEEVGMKNIKIHVSEKLLGEEAFPVLVGTK